MKAVLPPIQETLSDIPAPLHYFFLKGRQPADVNILIMTKSENLHGGWRWRRKSSSDGEKQPALVKKKGVRRMGRGLSGYAHKQIPEGAAIDYIFYEDFNGDEIKEAIIGFTQFAPFPPESSAVFIKPAESGYESTRLVIDESFIGTDNGIYDCAAAADTDGDGKPELVLALAAGNGHYITVFVFDWEEGEPRLAWRSGDGFFHGSVEICDPDGDGVYEIVVEEGNRRGDEILELNESCYHVRESFIYKWDGKSYIRNAFQVRMPYLSYNTAVEFLLGLWKQEYRRIYEMAVLPGFMGLEGLDGSSFAAFKKFIERDIRPELMRNLSKGKLKPAEPFDAYCLFSGVEDDFTVELTRDKGIMKVQAISIYKKTKYV